MPTALCRVQRYRVRERPLVWLAERNLGSRNTRNPAPIPARRLTPSGRRSRASDGSSRRDRRPGGFGSGVFAAPGAYWRAAGCFGGGGFEAGDGGVAGAFGGFEPLCRGLQVGVQLRAEALLGFQRGLRAGLFKLGGLTAVALLGQRSL